MNFVDKFDAKLPVNGLGAHPNAHLHVDSLATHAPSDAIIVPDAHLLFTGDFKRSGVDLILSDDDHKLVLQDYFKGENRAALSSPDGAHLTGDIVNALTGHVEYAQADGSASGAHVIGHVTKLAGTATALRNGVSIILNQGDNVEKGDVLQSGSDSTVGVTFIDGTVFGLSSNARMVLNEMVYDPNGSNNSSLLSLVAGTISFVAGETAKHGDMKVDTPVATMGIRGTAVLVEIDFNVPQGDAPDAKFQVLVEPDGSTGSYILFDKATLTPIATVNQAGTQVSISHGNVNFSATAPMSAEMQKLITDVFTLKFTDNSNVNTKTADHFTDTLTPQSFAPFILATGPTAIPVFLNVNLIEKSSSSNSNGPTTSVQHIDQPPAVVATSGSFIEHLGVTGSPTPDVVSGKISFVDINAGDLPTAKAVFNSFSYLDAHHNDITTTLTATELAAVKAVEIPLSVNQDPGNNNNGTATWTYSLPDGAFDFLGAGETLTLTYLAQVNNNYAPNNEITTKLITITITGTNDVPVITSSGPQTITFAAGTNTPGGDLTTKVPTSGTLSFADADLTDTHSVSTALVNAVLDGNTLPPGPLQTFESALTASITADSTGTGSGTVNWKLADLPVYLADFIPNGETLTLTYAVTVKDSQGATATQDITVTITGTAAPAVVWVSTTTPGSPPGGLWSDPSNWETGTVPTASDDAIVITNQLIGLTPSYPVRINAPAVARSLTMNDFGTSPPQLINQSTLTIGGAVNMGADSIIDNSGTISVGGLMEVLNKSVLQNSGLIRLGQGGDFRDQSTISNAGTGTIEVSGGTLNVQVDVANSGHITVDANAALTLDAATITGGSVTNHGAIDLTGTAVLKNGSLANTGQINVSGAGNALDNETVTNASTIEVLALGVLTLDQLTTIANAGGTIAIDGTGTLTLNDATISGGIINDYSSAASGSIIAGDIDVTGSSTINGGASLNKGDVTIESGQTLTLDNVTVTGTTFTDTATGAIIQIDGGTTLTLNGATINGGTINDYSSVASGSIIAGDIDIAGSSAIIGASLNNGHVTVESGQTLTLDNVTVTGTTFADTATGAIIQIDGGTTLKLKGATINGGTINDYSSAASGSIIAGDIDVTGSSTISNANLNHGNVTIESGQTLTLDNVTVIGTTITETDDSSIVQIDGGTTLKLSGATIDGGTINDYSSGASGSIIAGDIDVTGDSTISDAFLNKGNVTIANGATLTLDDDTVTGTTFTGVATGSIIQVDSNDALTLSGVTINGGAVSIGTHAHVQTSGNVTLADTSVVNNGTIEVHDGTLKLTGSIGGYGGSVQIDGGALFEINGSDTQNVVFSGTAAELQIDGSSFGGTIVGLAATDELDLRTIGYGLNTTGTYVSDANHDGGVLTITDGTHSISMTLVGDYSDAHFAGATDGNGGTLVTLNAADDAPAFAPAETAQSATLTELANTTGSSSSDPSPAASGSIHFTDIDLTDRPTATITAQSVTWTDADQDSPSSSLTQPEIDALEHALSLVQTGNTNNGAIGWTYEITDSALDFLGAGETAKVVSTVTLKDQDGMTDTATVTVTIDGSNDLPVLAADASGSNGSNLHVIYELPNTTGDSTNLDTTSGTLTFTDVDLTDTHIVSESAPTFTWSASNGNPLVLTADQQNGLAAASKLVLTEHDSTGTGAGSVDFAYSAADNNFDFLGAGQTLAITYDLTVTDNNHVTSTEPITITITGSNDAPAIVSETDPSIQTIILTKLPTVLGAGITTNSLGMHTETFDSHSAGSVSNNGSGHGNFTSLALDATFTASGDAGIVHGSSSVTAPPFFGPLPGHADTTNYLSIGAHGSETITFAGDQNEFGLYWGSADSFNTITFYDGNKLVASYTGADVTPLLANGNQGSFSSNGYVEFSDLAPFDKVVLGTGSSNAFEIDNVSAGFVSDSHVHLASPITGILTVSDADIGDTLTASVTGNAVVEYNGSTTLPSDVNVAALIDPRAVTFDSVKTTGGLDVLDWTYNPTNADLDFLEPGDTLSVTFKAQVSDGHVATGNQSLTVTLVGAGSSVVNGTSQNDMFADVGGGVTIFGRGGQDTFVFNKDFGSATIGDFNVNNDTIDIDHSLFASVSALLASAHPANFGHDTIITDAAHDKITLAGVTVAQIQAHPNDFHLI